MTKVSVPVQKQKDQLLVLKQRLLCCTCHLTQSITNVVDRLALELEPVDLEDLVPGVKLAGPLGRAALHNAAYDHALALVAHGCAL